SVSATATGSLPGCRPCPQRRSWAPSATATGPTAATRPGTAGRPSTSRAARWSRQETDPTRRTPTLPIVGHLPEPYHCSGEKTGERGFHDGRGRRAFIRAGRRLDAATATTRAGRPELRRAEPRGPRSRRASDGVTASVERAAARGSAVTAGDHRGLLPDGAAGQAQAAAQAAKRPRDLADHPDLFPGARCARVARAHGPSCERDSGRQVGVHLDPYGSPEWNAPG